MYTSKDVRHDLSQVNKQIDRLHRNTKKPFTELLIDARIKADEEAQRKVRTFNEFYED